MKERPIIFRDHEVRAVLDGRKTQFRRVAWLPGPIKRTRFLATSQDESIECFDDDTFHYMSTGGMSGPYQCPFGVPGDRMWVREKRARYPFNEPIEPCDIWYMADGKPPPKNTGPNRWRPACYMPRSASRITLEITDVRVQRLQDISEEDVKAEGLDGLTKDGKLVKYGIPDRDGLPGNDDTGWPWCNWHRDPIIAYQRLWDSTNAKRAPWSSNPWVWAITFRMMGRDEYPKVRKRRRSRID